MNCRDCYEPIIFQDRQPFDFTVCDCGRLVATVLHYRNQKHIASSRQRRPRRPIVPKDRELKPKFGTHIDGATEEEQAALNALIAKALKEAES